MTTTKPTALITGFGPFPGVPLNATTLLVPRLASAARQRFPNWRFASAILPTEWHRAPVELARHHARARPLWALHFGVSREARGFVIETTGRNLCRETADAAGVKPGCLCLDADGPPIRAVNLPLDIIRRRLDRRGLPAASSDDAGGYLCNAILYHSLGHAGRAPRPVRSGFIHVPADLGQPGSALSLADALAGGLEILSACLEDAGDPA